VLQSTAVQLQAQPRSQSTGRVWDVRPVKAAGGLEPGRFRIPRGRWTAVPSPDCGPHGS